MSATQLSTRHLFALVSILIFTACGGGGGGDGGIGSPATFTISVNVSNLKGNAVLQNNGGDNMRVSADGTFTFTNKAAGYNVSVLTQPLSGKTCVVTNGSGTATTNVSNINVTCADNTAPRYAYAVNKLDSSIATYVVDNPSGRLKYIGKLSTTSSNPTTITIDPTGKHAYVLNASSNNISQYAISNNGTLTPMTPATVAAGTKPLSVTIDPLGRYAYTANEASGSVSAYTIDASTGALTQIDCGGGAGCDTKNFLAGIKPQSVTIDSTGQFVYVTNNGSNSSGNDADVTAYKINPSGALTQINCVAATGCHGNNFAAGIYPQAMTIDPTGTHAYVVNNFNNTGGNNISQYDIDPNTGALTAMSTPTVPAGAAPIAIATDPAGKYAYVVNSFDGTDGNSISQYVIGATGELAAMSVATVATGRAPQSIAVDRGGKFAYVTNSTDNTISTYSIGATGALTAAAPATAPSFSSPAALAIATGNIAVQAVPKYAYAVNYGNCPTIGCGSITPYTIQPTNGTLISNPNITASAGIYPTSIAIDPTGRYAYVTNFGSGVSTVDNTISQYTIEPNGTLKAMNPAAIPSPNNSNNVPAGHPSSIVVEPLGRYAYVANQDGTISQLTIGSDGTLTPMTPATVASGVVPFSVVVDPSGRYVYATNSGGSPKVSGTVSRYQIGSNGTLSLLGTVAAGAEPYAIAIHPSGQRAYVLNKADLNSTSSIYQFPISATDGALGTITANVTAGINPLSIAIDAAEHVYVVNYGNSNLMQYTVTAGTLASSPSATIATDLYHPYSVTVDASGNYIYVANEGANNISQYKVTGNSILPLGTIAAGSNPHYVVTTSSWQ